MTSVPDKFEQEKSERPKGFDDFDVTLGDIMRGERATLGKSLLDVQRELKIKATYIAAIENSDPSAFETPGFVAGYVRSYARYLGLDPEWAFRTFCDEGNFVVQHGMSADRAVKGTAKKAPREAKSQPKGGRTPAHLRDPFTEPSVSYLPKSEALFSGIEPRAIGSILVLLVLLGGIGYGGWSVLEEVQKVTFAPVEQTPEVLAELDPLEAATRPIEGDEDDAGVETPVAAAGFDRLYRPEALEVPVMVARDGPIASIDPARVGVLAPEGDEGPITARRATPQTLPFSATGVATSADPATAPEPEIARLDENDLLPSVQVVEATSPSVSLLAVRPSWVRVRAPDGTVIFEKILDAGEQFDVPLTESPATLRAGNAGSLYFSVNGKTYGPAGDGPSVIKNVALAPDILTETYAIADLDRDADLARFVAVAEAQPSE